MLVYICDICEEEGTLETLRRVILRLGHYPNEGSRVWEICERCEPRLLDLLGGGREWSLDKTPVSAGSRR